MKHTQGPWFVNSRDKSMGPQEIMSKGVNYPCHVASTNPENAQLISAAPEMYETLIKIRDGLEKQENWTEQDHWVFGLVNIAIKRARGII